MVLASSMQSGDLVTYEWPWLPQLYRPCSLW